MIKQEPDCSAAFWDSYDIPDGESSITVEDERWSSVNCWDSCLIEGNELLGVPFEVARELLGREDGLGEGLGAGYAAYYSRLGLTLMVDEGGVVESATCESPFGDDGFGSSIPQELGHLIALQSPHQPMPEPTSPEIETLRAAYAAFNARDINAALALMTDDVAWPRAFRGGFVRGPQAVREYWTEQWGEIDPRVEPMAFHPEGDGRILVDVHQVVRDLGGNVMADERVGHLFAFEGGLIQGMEVLPLSKSGQPA